MSNDITALADFEETTFDTGAMYRWAKEHGVIPQESAWPFAQWLDRTWNDWDDASGTQTNEDILKGALAYWTGQ